MDNNITDIRKYVKKGLTGILLFGSGLLTNEVYHKLHKSIYDVHISLYNDEFVLSSQDSESEKYERKNFDNKEFWATDIQNGTIYVSYLNWENKPIGRPKNIR